MPGQRQPYLEMSHNWETSFPESYSQMFMKVEIDDLLTLVKDLYRIFYGTPIEMLLLPNSGDTTDAVRLPPQLLERTVL